MTDAGVNTDSVPQVNLQTMKKLDMIFEKVIQMQGDNNRAAKKSDDFVKQAQEFVDETKAQKSENDGAAKTLKRQKDADVALALLQSILAVYKDMMGNEDDFRRRESMGFKEISHLFTIDLVRRLLRAQNTMYGKVYKELLQTNGIEEAMGDLRPDQVRQMKATMDDMTSWMTTIMEALNGVEDYIIEKNA